MIGIAEIVANGPGRVRVAATWRGQLQPGELAEIRDLASAITSRLATGYAYRIAAVTLAAVGRADGTYIGACDVATDGEHLSCRFTMGDCEADWLAPLDLFTRPILFDVAVSTTGKL